MRPIFRVPMFAGLVLLGLAWPFVAAAAKDRALETMEKEKRLALVVGNADYPTAPLNNPVNDARAMARSLESLGFTVTTVINADQTALRRAIVDFGTKLREQQGVGLFYFAGHGMQVEGRNFLIPTGAQVETEADVTVEGVDVAYVLARMEGARNRLNIVILDACRNNPFARSFRSANQGLASVDAPTGSIIAFATAPGSVASDGSGEHGLYTGNLVQAMREPGLKIEDVFKRVRANVTKVSSGKQVPWESSSLIGDFYFHLPASLEPGATAATTPSDEPRVDDLDKEMVVSRTANVRKEPSASSARLATLAAGTRLQVVGRIRGADWYQVKLRDGDIGFVFADLLTDPPTQSAATPEPQGETTADEAELAFWQTIMHSRNPADFQAYLAAYPTGQFAPLARSRATPAAAQPAATQPAATQPAATQQVAAAPAQAQPPAGTQLYIPPREGVRQALEHLDEINKQGKVNGWPWHKAALTKYWEHMAPAARACKQVVEAGLRHPECRKLVTTAEITMKMKQAAEAAQARKEERQRDWMRRNR